MWPHCHLGDRRPEGPEAHGGCFWESHPCFTNVLETLAGSSSRGAATGSEQKDPHPASVQCRSAALAVAQRDRDEGHRDVL